MSDDRSRYTARRHQVLRRVEFSVCYHRKRERFFELLDRWTKGVAIIGGSAAFVGLVEAVALPGGGVTAQLFAALVAITSTLALVFGFAEHARRHAELARHFLELEGEIVAKDENHMDSSDVSKWESRARMVEAGEPPALNALVVICQNEVAIANREPIYILPWRQRVFAHWWSFTLDPTKLKKEQSVPPAA